MEIKNRVKIKKEELLEQGIELIAEHGYHGTGLKKILDTVKIPKGSFYNYFDSKEDFVAQVITKYSILAQNRIEEYLKSSVKSTIEDINSIFEGFLINLEDTGFRGCLIGNLVGEIGNSSAICKAAIGNAYERWHKFLKKLIKNGQTERSIRKDIDSETIADTLWVTWQGAILKAKIDGNTNQVRKVISITLSNFMV